MVYILCFYLKKVYMNSLNIRNIMWIAGLLFVGACSGGKDPLELDSDSVVKTYIFPDDFTNDLVGKEVTLKNAMFVSSTYKGSATGNITLSSQVLRTPTDKVMPGTSDYKKALEENMRNKLVLIPGEIVLTDEDHTLRVGTRMENLKGKVSVSGDKYALTITDRPVIKENRRPQVPEVGKYNMKVASMNLEYYMASPSMWGHSNGAKDEAAFQRQRKKVLAAMKEIDADVYAICEIEEGDYSINELVQALNEEYGVTGKYKGIDSGDKKITSYTKNAFIYDTERVSPYMDFKTYEGTYLVLRHVAQCFELKENGSRVILAMNHFESKSGNNATGGDKDQQDGQSQFNSRRVQEAKDCLLTYENLKKYYGDTDVLVLGDLNSYSNEDPVRIFTEAGYTNELQKYTPDSWSYVYQGEVGYLDHSLSSSTLTGQVTGAAPWDINASEPAYFEYQYTSFFQPNPYRYSDHNPIITGLKLTD